MKLINRNILFVIVSLILILGSCINAGSEKSKIPEFPAVPDKIVVGFDGEEKEILPENAEFERITSVMKERVPKGKVLESAPLATGNGDDHITNEIRKEEVFVEYIYNEPTIQKNYRPGETSAQWEEISPMRIFFPLTGEHHADFFMSADANYESNMGTYGRLNDDTELIDYVQKIFSEEVSA